MTVTCITIPQLKIVAEVSFIALMIYISNQTDSHSVIDQKTSLSHECGCMNVGL